MLSHWEEVRTSIKSLISANDLPPLIIMAGGKSSRMGYPKGLLKHQDRPLIMLLLDVFRRAGGKKAVIVLGHHISSYFEELSFLNGLTPPCDVKLGSLNLSIVVNNDYEQGPFSSVQAGIRFFKNDLEKGILFHAVDRISCQISSWHTLCNAAYNSNHNALFYEKNNTKIQPVWLSQTTALDVLKETPQTARFDNIMDKIGFALPYSNDFGSFNLNTKDNWEEIKPLLPDVPPFTLEIKGEKRSGKTSFLKRVVSELSQQGFKVGGILQPSLNGDFDSSGYDVENVATGEHIPLARRRETPAKNGLWFDFYDDAWSYAKKTIIDARKNADILVVDEIGKLEAQGLGHMIALNESVPCETALIRLLGVRI
ncbi:MAG: NTP transferase domain-containing protein [Alphaproteobacteria bacterium]